MREVDPKQTKRARAFDMWMRAPMPMITLFKTWDVTRLIRFGRRHGYRINVLLCWCIARAASHLEEFYFLPKDGKLLQYDKLAVNVVVNTKDGGINTCDVPFYEDFEQFNDIYSKITKRTWESCEAYEAGEDFAIIGTSALVKYDIDGAVNLYSGIYNNPFLVWGRYRMKGLKRYLHVSMQFHHTQMDGAQAAEFLDLVQKEIREIRVNVKR